MRGSKIVQILVCVVAVTACATRSEEEESGASSADQTAEGGESALGSNNAAAACVKRNDDCSWEGKGCCSGSVCAFGGEREGAWCQAFEPLAWKGSCVQARKGARVRTKPSMSGPVCITLEGGAIPGTCHEVKNGFCLVGWNGECGESEYFIHSSALVQVDMELCR